MKKQLCVLGATGSIGTSTLDVLSLHTSQYEIFALSAHVQAESLFQLCLKWRPKYAVLSDTNAAAQFRQLQQSSDIDTELLEGQDGLISVASDERVDIVVAAIVGAAGLASSLAAAHAGKRILLANKEALVMAGDLFMQALATSSAELLPIDSEHNAIFQCLPDDYRCGNRPQYLRRIILTASGGPFRLRDLNDFSSVSVEEACAHPNWNMGQKISVDSATMMNKGLELIEACYLFGCDVNDIELLIHPQSIIHSMVEFDDGSVLAQMGSPDMRTPITHALAWPQRIDSGVSSLDFTQHTQLSFESVDFRRFPGLKLAIDAARQGQEASLVLNAANEIAVAAFLQHKIRFIDIAFVIDAVLNKIKFFKTDDLLAIEQLDADARRLAAHEIAVI